MSDRIDTPDFSPQLPPLPAESWKTRPTYLIRDDQDPSKVSMLVVDSPAKAKHIKDATIAAFEETQKEQVVALKADNLTAFNVALGRHIALACEILGVQETGDNTMREVDGAWEAGHCLVHLTQRYPVETFHLKIDQSTLLSRVQRVYNLVELRDNLDSARIATHQSLGYELGILEPILRDAHNGLGPHVTSNWTLRRLATSLIDYVTGAAKLAAERARQNKRLIENTRNSILAQFKNAESKDAAPAPAATPPKTPPPGRHLDNG